MATINDIRRNSRGKLYEDPEFEATDENIFFSQKPPRPFVWKRPAVSWAWRIRPWIRLTYPTLLCLVKTNSGEWKFEWTLFYSDCQRMQQTSGYLDLSPLFFPEYWQSINDVRSYLFDIDSINSKASIKETAVCLKIAAHVLPWWTMPCNLESRYNCFI